MYQASAPVGREAESFKPSKEALNKCIVISLIRNRIIYAPAAPSRPRDCSGSVARARRYRCRMPGGPCHNGVLS